MHPRPYSTQLQADFLTGPNGRLFTVYTAPPDNIGLKGCLLLLPPFAEEMNRSRHFMASLARTLAATGIGVLIGDLYGTGDSDGDFSDADWDIWQNDITALLNKALTLADGLPLWLGGTRTGALLCAQSLQGLAEGHKKQISGTLFVQPVKSGAQFLTQFLRIRQAAAMAQGKKETVSDLRKRIEDGEHLKVGGYILNPALARSLDRVKLSDFAPFPHMGIEWFETGPMEKSDDNVAQGVPDPWKQRTLCAHFFQAEQFWSMQEPITPMDLVRFIGDHISKRMRNA